MANRRFRKTIAWLLEGGAGGPLSGLDLRVLAFRPTSTIPAELGAEFLDDFTLLDELDATGYSREALAAIALNEDAPQDFFKLEADPADFGVLTGGSDKLAGWLVYVHLGADSANRPLVLIEDRASGPGLPYMPYGQPVVVDWAADGIIAF